MFFIPLTQQLTKNVVDLSKNDRRYFVKLHFLQVLEDRQARQCFSSLTDQSKLRRGQDNINTVTILALLFHAP